MSITVGVDTNFGFLEPHSPMLHKLAQQAERYFAEDPNTALIKLRQFGEVLARQLAALTNTLFATQGRSAMRPPTGSTPCENQATEPTTR